MNSRSASDEATRSVRVSGYVAFGLSLAANVAATFNEGWIARIAGAATPILLMLAIHMWRHAPVSGSVWTQRFAFVSMCAIVTPVAITSYYHAGSLLAAIPNMPIWLAWVTPLSVDGLAVRAVLVLQPTSTRPTEQSVVRPAESTEPRVAEPDPATSTEPPEFRDETNEQSVSTAGQPDDSAPTEPKAPKPKVSVETTTDAQLLQRTKQLLEREPRISKPRLAEQLGVSKYRAAQLRQAASNGYHVGVA